MSAEKNIVVNLTVDTSKIVAAIESARISMIRLRECWFGLAPDDISRQFPTCNSPVSHESWFTTEGTKGYPCPGCGAAL